MIISLIAAMSENRIIGRDGGVPWHLSSDLKRFKQITMGHHLVMGRKTWQSLNKLLPGRKSIVLTRQHDLHLPGAMVVHDLDAAIEHAEGEDELFIIGGAQIYALALPRADRLYLSFVHANLPGDTSFPMYDETQWETEEESYHPADKQNEYAHTFVVYERRNKRE